MGLDRGDSVLRVSLLYQPHTHVRLTTGVDIFSGSNLGLYGQFDEQDRVYLNSELVF